MLTDRQLTDRNPPTPEQDRVLRRLHSLEQLGVVLSPELRQVRHEIRLTDRRIDVRDPEHVVAMAPLRA